MDQRAATHSSSRVDDRELFPGAERKVRRTSLRPNGRALIRRVGTEIHSPPAFPSCRACSVEVPSLHLDSGAILNRIRCTDNSTVDTAGTSGRHPSSGLCGPLVDYAAACLFTTLGSAFSVEASARTSDATQMTKQTRLVSNIFRFVRLIDRKKALAMLSCSRPPQNNAIHPM
jgi:hypothetical protein